MSSSTLTPEVFRIIESVVHSNTNLRNDIMGYEDRQDMLLKRCDRLEKENAYLRQCLSTASIQIEAQSTQLCYLANQRNDAFRRVSQLEKEINKHRITDDSSCILLNVD